jgi:predicted RNase H-like nuclease (RuvC/YqgF family)
VSFELLGVKAVRAFDATVVIVSLATHGGESSDQRVVGSVLTEVDPGRAAALAVLNATNRILGNRLFMR